MFTAILNTEVRAQFENIPGYGTEFEVPQSAEGYAQLHRLPEGETKEAVLGAFADALRVGLLSSTREGRKGGDSVEDIADI